MLFLSYTVVYTLDIVLKWNIIVSCRYIYFVLATTVVQVCRVTRNGLCVVWLVPIIRSYYIQPYQMFVYEENYIQILRFTGKCWREICFFFLFFTAHISSVCFNISWVVYICLTLCDLCKFIYIFWGLSVSFPPVRVILYKVLCWNVVSHNMWLKPLIVHSISGMNATFAFGKCFWYKIL